MWIQISSVSWRADIVSSPLSSHVIMVFPKFSFLYTNHFVFTPSLQHMVHNAWFFWVGSFRFGFTKPVWTIYSLLRKQGIAEEPTHIELPGSERVAVLLWVHMRALTGGVQNEWMLFSKEDAKKWHITLCLIFLESLICFKKSFKMSMTDAAKF